jgi:glycogen synthase
VRRALCSYVDRQRWAKVVRACMAKDFSWKASARAYVSLYRALSARAAA